MTVSVSVSTSGMIVAIAVVNNGVESSLVSVVLDGSYVAAWLVERVFSGDVLSVTMFLVAVEILGVMILDSVGEFVLWMSYVVVVFVTVFVLPRHLLGVAFDRSVEMLEGVSLVTHHNRHPDEGHSCYQCDLKYATIKRLTLEFSLTILAPYPGCHDS